MRWEVKDVDDNDEDDDDNGDVDDNNDSGCVIGDGNGGS